MSIRGKYGKWDTASLANALEAYRRGDFGLNECSRQFGIPKATLKRHLENKNKRANDNIKRMGTFAVFSEDIERELVQHILALEGNMFGMTIRDVRKLAFEIAVRNNIKNNFNQEKRMAGKKWYYKFMSRHKELSLRQPESTSLARAKGFNQARVDAFFSLLIKICDDEKLTPAQIFNVDETGCSTVQRKCQKVVALRGKGQVGGISSGERGINTTAVCCASAAGQFIPPMIIFKRKRYSEDLASGAPPGSVVTISDSGYINSELFVRWLKHFVDFIKPSKENPVLLLLDGHSTHSKNLEALNLARMNGIRLLQLPSHTTHRLQPLDVGFFRSFQTFYSQAVEKWLRTNVGRTVSMFQVSALIGEAYGYSATVRNATNAFRATGIWPIDRNIFNETDFAASRVLNGQDKPDIEQQLQPESSSDDDQPLINLVHRKRPSTSSLAVSIQDISPLPVKKHAKPIIARKSRTQEAVELTSSPYKNDLEALRTKPSRSGLNNLKKVSSKSLKTLTAEIGSSKTKKYGTESENWFCNICCENRVAEMIQCMSCKTWQHAKCAKVSGKGKVFHCAKCKK